MLNSMPIPAVFGFGTLAFGSVIAASYTTLLTNTRSGIMMIVDNLLDKDVFISNTTTNQIFVKAGTSKTIDFGNNSKLFNGNVGVKAVADATSGNIYVTLVS